MEVRDLLSLAGIVLAIGGALLGFAFKITREIGRLAAALEALGERVVHGLEGVNRRLDIEAEVRRDGDRELGRQIEALRTKGH